MKRWASLISAGLIAISLHGGSALAAPSYPSRVSIRAGVDSGGTLSGRVVAAHPKCERYRTVHVFRNGVYDFAVGANAYGRWNWNPPYRLPRGTYKAKVQRDVRRVNGRRIICEAAESGRVRV